MGMFGFNLIDKEYQKERTGHEQRLREEVMKEMENNGFRFNDHERDWAHRNFPYGSREAQLQAERNEQAAQEAKQAQIDAEVTKRMEELDTNLQRNHFGEKGRQFALEQAQREQTILDFQERERKKREREQQTIEQNKSQGHSIAQQQREAAALEQDNTHVPEMGKDFKKIEQQGRTANRIREANERIKAFQDRTRVEPTNEGPEQEPESQTFEWVVEPSRDEPEAEYEQSSHTYDPDRTVSEEFSAEVRADMEGRSAEQDTSIERE